MTREEFLNDLSKVDWYYEYLEDLKQYRAAQDFYFKINFEAQCNKEFGKLFDEERTKYYPLTEKKE